jgi:hypothetical protein
MTEKIKIEPRTVPFWEFGKVFALYRIEGETWVEFDHEDIPNIPEFDDSVFDLSQHIPIQIRYGMNHYHHRHSVCVPLSRLVEALKMIDEEYLNIQDELEEITEIMEMKI